MVFNSLADQIACPASPDNRQRTKKTRQKNIGEMPTCTHLRRTLVNRLKYETVHEGGYIELNNRPSRYPENHPTSFSYRNRVSHFRLRRSYNFRNKNNNKKITHSSANVVQKPIIVQPPSIRKNRKLNQSHNSRLS